MKSFRLLPLAAALGAAMSVQAADVEMFGFFDQGLAYVHEELNKGMASPTGQTTANHVVNGKVEDGVTRSNLAQGTGNVSTWGIKGSEVLTPDTKVIFHLESGFLADDGTIYGPKHNQLFERESSLGIESQTWGQLKFGRMRRRAGRRGLLRHHRHLQQQDESLRRRLGQHDGRLEVRGQPCCGPPRQHD